MQVKTFQIRLTPEFLVKDQESLNTFLNSVTIKKSATQLINGAPDYWSVLLYYTNEKPRVEVAPAERMAAPESSELSAEETKIYEALKEWRGGKAREQNLSPYIVSSNADLMRVAKIKPSTTDELGKIKGFREKKVAKYGGDIIALLNSVA